MANYMNKVQVDIYDKLLGFNGILFELNGEPTVKLKKHKKRKFPQLELTATLRVKKKRTLDMVLTSELNDRHIQIDQLHGPFGSYDVKIWRKKSPIYGHSKPADVYLRLEP